MSGTRKHDLVVAHYHEVGLKGRNRSFFERRLVDNIRWALRDTGYAHVRTIPGRILVELTEKGKRLGREHTWKDLLGGDAAPSAALNTSLGQGS